MCQHSKEQVNTPTLVIFLLNISFGGGALQGYNSWALEASDFGGAGAEVGDTSYFFICALLVLVL